MAKIQQYTFREFQAAYGTDDDCLNAVLRRKYGDEITCPGCGVIGAKFHKITGRRAFACQDCGHHLYPCVGTPFEHSSTPLTLWFHAMYLMTATRNGVSGKELQRQLGVTYKCAWRIGHQLRLLMAARDAAQNPGPLSGHVEVDETFIGGKIHRGKGTRQSNKTIVMGMIERGGAFKGQIVESTKSAHLFPVILKNIAPGTMINTDNWKGYKNLKKMGFGHESVNHTALEWARGIHYTNSVESFWSHLKRGISSTHVSVSPQHLEKYVNEFGFRYNFRKQPGAMFERLLTQISSPFSSPL
jgi:transposase-like protein